MNGGPNGSTGDGRIDQLDAGRSIWIDLGWRSIQVFLATMLVAVSGSDFIGAAKNLKFWEDALSAAIVAVITGVLALASSRAGIPAPPSSRTKEPPEAAT